MSIPLPPASIFDKSDLFENPSLTQFEQYLVPHALDMHDHLERVKEEGEAWAALEALEAMIRGQK